MAQKRIQGLSKLLETLSHMKGKTHLMICEFIDNSISSWLDDGKNISTKGLKISIIADFSSINNDKQTISVTDNAYGMDEAQLENGLTLGLRMNKKSKLSVFGMGLKQASFWLGRKLEIYTTREGEKTVYSVIDLEKIALLKDSDEAFYEMRTIDENRTRGTTIFISDINNGVEKSSVFYVQKLKRVLGWKYNRFIHEGLAIDITIKKERNQQNVEVKKFFPTAENITEWSTSEGKDIEKTKTDLIHQINQTLKDNSFRKCLIERIEKNEDLMFEVPIKFQNCESHLYYGILSVKHRMGTGDYKDLAYARVSGITIYQANRAIFCGPNEAGGGNFYQAKTNAGSEDIFQIKLFGFAILDPFVDAGIITLDTNKQAFKWDDTAFKKHFEQVIENLKKSGLKQAVSLIGKYQQNTGKEGFGPSPKKSNISKIEKELIKRAMGFEGIKVTVPEAPVETSNGDLVRPLVISNIKIGENIDTIVLIEEKRTDGSFITSTHEDTSIVVRVNINHDLWTPYMASSTDEIKRNIVYPLSVMIGIAKFAMDSESYEEKEDFDNLLIASRKLVTKGN